MAGGEKWRKGRGVEGEAVCVGGVGLHLRIVLDHNSEASSPLERAHVTCFMMSLMTGPSAP